MQIVPTLQLTAAVVKRPDLYATALGSLGAIARKDWWKRAPFLPIPDPRYLKWRVATAYGSESADLTADDLIAFLEWRSAQRDT